MMKISSDVCKIVVKIRSDVKMLRFLVVYTNSNIFAKPFILLIMVSMIQKVVVKSKALP